MAIFADRVDLPRFWYVPSPYPVKGTYQKLPEDPVPEQPQIRVDSTALVVGNPGFIGHWTDGYAEIRTGRPLGSQAIEAGLRLLVSPEAFADLFRVMEQLAAQRPVADRLAG